MTTVQPRGRYAKGMARREEILDAALVAFSENGYDRTSFREIARSAGLSQAGLLHYFKSKEELFVEVLRRRDERNERLYDENRGDPVTAEGLVSIVRHNAEEPGLVGLFVAMSAESTVPGSAAGSFFADRYRALRRGLAADIEARQARGEVVPDPDAEAIASLLLAAADGLQIQWLLDPHSIDMGARLEALWNALQRTDPEPA